MAYKEFRSMKVYKQSGYRFQDTPTIMLKGLWLRELGFEEGVPIIVKCEGGRLTITKANEIESTCQEASVEPVRSSKKYESEPMMRVAESEAEYSIWKNGGKC